MSAVNASYTRAPDRNEMVRRLRSDTFDILVIGGGITGAWIARDAALRGLKVGLVERRDFASGTSSRSSRLVHGGLRYLRDRHISLVRESLRERGLLLQLAPHIVRPIPFLIPAYEGDHVGPLLLRLGLTGYDLLAGSRRIGWHRGVPTAQISREEPALRREGLRGGFRYFDAVTRDARLTLAVLLGAVEHGAAAANYVEAVSWETSAGRLAGVNCKDSITGGLFAVRAMVVVVAAGPWTDELRALNGDTPVLRPTKGIHIVVPRGRLRTKSVVAFFWEGRPYFAVPVDEHTYIGTTDTDWTGDPAGAVATAEDVAGVLAAANASFDADLTEADVTATWAGVRPLVAEEGSPAPSDVSRDFEILEGPAGVYTVCGGKLTTGRSMAEAVVNRVAEKELGRLSVRPGKCRTHRVRLPGATAGFEGFRRQAVLDMRSGWGLAEDTARHLVDTYGTRYRAVLTRSHSDEKLLMPLGDGTRVIGEEAAYAAAAEMAVTLEDFMRRRSDLMIFGTGAHREVASTVAEVMGGVLGWDAARKKAEVDACVAEGQDMLSFRRPVAGSVAPGQ